MFELNKLPSPWDDEQAAYFKQLVQSKEWWVVIALPVDALAMAALCARIKVQYFAGEKRADFKNAFVPSGYGIMAVALLRKTRIKWLQLRRELLACGATLASVDASTPEHDIITVTPAAMDVLITVIEFGTTQKRADALLRQATSELSKLIADSLPWPEEKGEPMGVVVDHTSPVAMHILAHFVPPEQLDDVERQLKSTGTCSHATLLTTKAVVTEGMMVLGSKHAKVVSEMELRTHLPVSVFTAGESFMCFLPYPSGDAGAVGGRMRNA